MLTDWCYTWCQCLTYSVLLDNNMINSLWLSDAIRCYGIVVHIGSDNDQNQCWLSVNWILKKQCLVKFRSIYKHFPLKHLTPFGQFPKLTAFLIGLYLKALFLTNWFYLLQLNFHLSLMRSDIWNLKVWFHKAIRRTISFSLCISHVWPVISDVHTWTQHDAGQWPADIDMGTDTGVTCHILHWTRVDHYYKIQDNILVIVNMSYQDRTLSESTQCFQHTAHSGQHLAYFSGEKEHRSNLKFPKSLPSMPPLNILPSWLSRIAKSLEQVFPRSLKISITHNYFFNWPNVLMYLSNGCHAQCKTSKPLENWNTWPWVTNFSLISNIEATSMI